MRASLAPLGSFTLGGPSVGSTGGAAPLGQVGLVFQPGGTAAPGVFVDLTSLQTASRFVRGECVIQCDFSFQSGGAFTFPGANYNFGPFVRFRGLPDSDPTSIGYPKINLAAGVVFTPVPQMLLLDNVQVTANNTAAPCITNAGHFTLQVLQLGQILMGGSATKPFIQNPPGTVLTMFGKDLAYTAGVAAAGVVNNADGTATTNVSLYDVGFCDVNTFQGTITGGSLNITTASPAAGCDGSFAKTLNLFPLMGFSGSFANPNGNVTTGGNLNSLYASNAAGPSLWVWNGAAWVQFTVP